jgi:hypothetical protein
MHRLARVAAGANGCGALRVSAPQARGRKQAVNLPLDETRRSSSPAISRNTDVGRPSPPRSLGVFAQRF